MSQLKVKRSSNLGLSPVSLDPGELFLDMLNGVLKWPDSNGTIQATPLLNLVTQAVLNAAVAQAITNLQSGAPATLNSFAEIATALADDPNAYTDLYTQISNRLRFDIQSTLTAVQQAQGLSNLGAQPVLGYNPVAQGTGPDQLVGYQVEIGLGASINRLKAAVGSADFGSIWTDRDCAFSKNGNGFIIEPSGLVLQWMTVAGNSDKTIAFPTTFPNAVFAVLGSCIASSGSAGVHSVEFASTSVSGTTVRPRVSSGGSVATSSESSYVMAVGY